MNDGERSGFFLKPERFFLFFLFFHALANQNQQLFDIYL